MRVPFVHRFWAWPSELKAVGILGINARNLKLIFPNNSRSRFPLVDNKARTKILCRRHGIPVPELYGVIERYGDIRTFSQALIPAPSFVIKPAAGAGGRGVLMIEDCCANEFRASGGQVLDIREIRYHLSTILSGLYSLGGNPDIAIIEERISVHPSFQSICEEGVPDIRVILYRERTVMAMLRLPTQKSRGRANLHQGAVAAGIDMKTGRTVGGVCNNRAVEQHPDTLHSLRGIEIPFWRDILDICLMLGRVLNIGYLGVDLVLDRNHGPLVLEANARPGLAIQIANNLGLLTILRNMILTMQGHKG